MARISSIDHRANAEPPTGTEAERRNLEAFTEAWQRRGLVVIYPDQITDDWERQTVINVANAKYGKRG
jgi:poly(3-hydroxybutyrate) depolymerase